MTFHAFFRAKKETPDPEGRSIPWPDIPVKVEGAVIVGRIAQSVNYIWHSVTQNADDSASLEALPGFFAPTYAILKSHGNGQDVLEAVIEESGAEGTIRRRVKMRNVPQSGVVATDLPPHFFAGLVSMVALIALLAFTAPVAAQGTSQPITAHWAEDALAHGLAGSYFALSMADWWQTIFGLSTDDFSEGNPAPNLILQRFGTTGLSVYKVSLTIVAVSIYEYLWIAYGRRGGKWTRVAIISLGIGMNAIQGLVVHHNSSLTITGVPIITF